MNRILNYIIEQRRGHYCHVLELANVYELEFIIESIYDEFIDNYYKEEIIDFFETIQICYYTEEEENKEEEEELYDFNITNFINTL
jgi:hypothetical protein